MAYGEVQRAAIYRYRDKHPDSTKNRMTIMLTPEDKSVLQAVSDRTGENRSEVMRRLLWEEAAKHGIAPRTSPVDGF